jgi:hypothetical protein
VIQAVKQFSVVLKTAGIGSVSHSLVLLKEKPHPPPPAVLDFLDCLWSHQIRGL